MAAMLMADSPNEEGVYVSVRATGLEPEVYDLIQITFDDKDFVNVEKSWYSPTETELAVFPAKENYGYKVEVKTILNGVTNVTTQYFGGIRYGEKATGEELLNELLSWDPKTPGGGKGSADSGEPEIPEPDDPDYPEYITTKDALEKYYTQGYVESIPGGEIIPSFIPIIKNQSAFSPSSSASATCVACAIVSALEIFSVQAQRAAGKTPFIEHYSVPYFYGSDAYYSDSTNIGMRFDHGAQNASAYGAPRWELISEDDNYYSYKSDAQAIFRKAVVNTIIRENANNQRIDEYYNVNFYNPSKIREILEKGGLVQFNFYMPSNMDVWNAASAQDAIVPRPTNYANDGHTMIIIGIKEINNVNYWICLNSWGEFHGHNGLYYVPSDWGYNINDKGIPWVQQCYALFGRKGGVDFPIDKPTIKEKFPLKDGKIIVDFTLPSQSLIVFYTSYAINGDLTPKPDYGTGYDKSPQEIDISDMDTRWSHYLLYATIDAKSYLMSELYYQRIVIDYTGYVYIATSRYTWAPTIPYIWNGTEWKKATPYIWDGTKWLGGN